MYKASMQADYTKVRDRRERTRPLQKLIVCVTYGSRSGLSVTIERKNPERQVTQVIPLVTEVQSGS